MHSAEEVVLTGNLCKNRKAICAFRFLPCLINWLVCQPVQVLTLFQMLKFASGLYFFFNEGYDTAYHILLMTYGLWIVALYSLLLVSTRFRLETKVVASCTYFFRYVTKNAIDAECILSFEIMLWFLINHDIVEVSFLCNHAIFARIWHFLSPLHF